MLHAPLAARAKLAGVLVAPDPFFGWCILTGTAGRARRQQMVIDRIATSAPRASPASACRTAHNRDRWRKAASPLHPRAVAAAVRPKLLLSLLTLVARGGKPLAPQEEYTVIFSPSKQN